MKKGILITLEGNEGCGKSTQIKLLCGYLKKQGRRVYLTREPGGTAIGDGIRRLLLDNKHARMSPECETLLYMASRAQLVSEGVAPRLKKGDIVLCDRWLDATLAYQGYGAGVDLEWIRRLGRNATQGIVPRLSIYLDLPVELGLLRARRRHKADRMEKKQLAFHRKVRRGYLKIAAAAPRRFKRLPIGGQDSVIAVHEKIKRLVRNVL